MDKITVKEIVKRVGVEEIALALAVSESSVRAARAAGRFPASWCEQLTAHCEAHGIYCPMSLFNMRRPERGAA